MTELQPNPHPRMTVRADQPLIGVIRQRQGQEVVEYFVEEADGDQASAQARRQRAVSLLGAWSHLDDSDDFLDELDRIRHQSKPTPPMELPELDQRRARARTGSSQREGEPARG